MRFLGGKWQKKNYGARNFNRMSDDGWCIGPEEGGQYREQQRLRGWRIAYIPTTAEWAMDGAPGRFRAGEENGQRLRSYFLRRGRMSGRMFFATILFPSAVAWVLSDCIMASTP